MQTQNSDTFSSSSTELKQLVFSSPHLNNNPCTSVSTTLRLWRPAAQRHLRNQWLKLVSQKQKWTKALSSGISHLSYLINSYLSQRYMPSMDLGLLSDMPDIRQRACHKLAQQQELHQSRLLSSYKDMVDIVSHMTNISSSMRCFFKGPAGSPLVQFSSHSENNDDLGDGGGIRVFTCWSIPYFEDLAKEFVQMFARELMLKRSLVVSLFSVGCKEACEETNELSWSDELYPGEFEDLSSCQLFSEENCWPIPPKFNSPVALEMLSKRQLNRETLLIYLKTWVMESNVDKHRVDEIFNMVGEEMKVNLL